VQSSWIASVRLTLSRSAQALCGMARDRTLSASDRHDPGRSPDETARDDSTGQVQVCLPPSGKVDAREMQPEVAIVFSLSWLLESGELFLDGWSMRALEAARRAGR
jgi:hypothetical protein